MFLNIEKVVPEVKRTREINSRGPMQDYDWSKIKYF